MSFGASSLERILVDKKLGKTGEKAAPSAKATGREQLQVV